MSQLHEKPGETMLDWLKAIAIWAFLGFWGFGIFISFTNGACRDFDRPAEQRLHLCKRGERLGGFLTTHTQKADALRFHAIALADLGRNQDATTLFKQSWTQESFRSGGHNYAHRETIRQMSNPEISEQARLVWKSAIAESTFSQ